VWEQRAPLSPASLVDLPSLAAALAPIGLMLRAAFWRARCRRPQKLQGLQRDSHSPRARAKNPRPALTEQAAQFVEHEASSVEPAPRGQPSAALLPECSRLPDDSASRTLPLEQRQTLTALRPPFLAGPPPREPRVARRRRQKILAMQASLQAGLLQQC